MHEVIVNLHMHTRYSDGSGSHKDIACKECHHEPVYRKSSQTAACYACHAKDDEHAGQFGQRCEQCHQTDSFKNIRIRR